MEFGNSIFLVIAAIVYVVDAVDTLTSQLLSTSTSDTAIQYVDVSTVISLHLLLCLFSFTSSLASVISFSLMASFAYVFDK